MHLYVSLSYIIIIIIIKFTYHNPSIKKATTV